MSEQSNILQAKMEPKPLLSVLTSTGEAKGLGSLTQDLNREIKLQHHDICQPPGEEDKTDQEGMTTGLIGNCVSLGALVLNQLEFGLIQLWISSQTY